MGFEFTFVTSLWWLYVVAAAALGALALRAPRIKRDNAALAALLFQQVLGTLAALVIFTSDLGDPVVNFHNGYAAWLLWAPVVFLAAPLLLHGSHLERPAWIVAAVGTLPSIVGLALWLVAPDLVFTDDGAAVRPYAVTLLLLAFVAFASTVGFFAREAFTTPLALRRGRFALLAAGFGAEGAFHAAQNGWQFLFEPVFAGIPADFPLAAPIALVPLAGFLAIAAYAGGLAFHKAPTETRRWALLVFGFLGGALLTGTVTASMHPGEEFRSAFGGFHALWDLACLCLVFFAGMRFELFSLERRAQQGLAVSAALLAGFLLFASLEQLAEGFLEDRFAGRVPMSNVVAALVVGGTSVPIARIGKTVGKRFLPGVDASADYEARRALQVYQAAVEGAYLDGHQDAAEVNSLKRLRASLGISDADASRVEAAVRASLPTA